MSGGKRRCKGCGNMYTGACSCTVNPTTVKALEVLDEVLSDHTETLQRLSSPVWESPEYVVHHNKPQSGGTKFDNGKPRMDLIPALAEEEEAYVWGFGAQKYGDENWKQGIKFRRIVGAIQRHLNAIKKGEWMDPEHGHQHAASIRCNAAMLIEFIKMGRLDLDDITPPEKKTAKN